CFSGLYDRSQTTLWSLAALFHIGSRDRDVRLEARGLPHLHGFFYGRYAEGIRAFIGQGLCDGKCTVAVSVRFHHRQNSYLRSYFLFYLAKVPAQSFKIDGAECGTSWGNG